MSLQLVYSKVLNQDYRGHAERCSYTFTVNKPDQLGARWTAIEHLNAHIEELQKQGSTILEYYLWEDKAPTWTTDYYCRIVASASVLAWFILISAVLIILGLITLFTIKEIKDITEYLGPDGITKIAQWAALATIAVACAAGIYFIKKKA